MQSGDHNEQQPEPLICMRDNVSVSTEDPRCPHPSSSCDFRELCPVKDAMRRKRREVDMNDPLGRGCGYSDK